MFSSGMFSQMRRAGMTSGISRTKLSQSMLEILSQLPEGTSNLKDTIVHHLGLFGQMASTRDISEAWIQTKKKAAKEYPSKFILDDRNVLRWNDGSVKIYDRKISASNFKRLNEVADLEGCSVNQLVSKLLKSYQKSITNSQSST